MSKRLWTEEFLLIRPEGKDGYPDKTMARTNGPDNKDFDIDYASVKKVCAKTYPYLEWVQYVGRDLAARRDWETRWGLIVPDDYEQYRGHYSCHRTIYELEVVSTGGGMKRLSITMMGTQGCVCGHNCKIGVKFWTGQDVDNAEMVAQLKALDA